MRKLLLISAALAVAACQKAPGAGAISPDPNAAATAPAGQWPLRRAGLWEQSVSNGGHASGMGAMRLCVGPTAEARAWAFAHGAGGQKMRDNHCSTNWSRGVDGAYAFASTCPVSGGGTVATKGSASGDFSTAYHVHLETDLSGAAYATMNGRHVTDIEGKWLGPCPADMASGDMELANGMMIKGGKFAGAAAALAGGGR